MEISREQSKPIDIKYGNQPNTHGKVNNFFYDEIGLKQNFFDPSKNSPPNNFVSKLKTRMTSYYTISLSSSPPLIITSFKRDCISSKK